MRAWTLAAVVVAALVACHDSGGTGPTQPQLKDGPSQPAGGDSTGKPLPSSVDVSGHVVAVERFWPPAANGDTLRSAPLAGASVALLLRTGVDDGVFEQPVAQTTTDAQGRWKLDDVAGGYYTLDVTPPAGSGLERASFFLSATAPTVVFTAQLWRP